MAFLTQALIILILVIYAVLLCRFRQKNTFLGLSIAVILLSGTALYYVAFSHEPVVEGPVTIFIRSMFDAVKMFFFEQELLEVEHIQEEPLFLDLFHLVYAAAMLTTVYAVLDIFAKRVMTKFVLLTHPYNVYKHVFFGMDSNSVHLANLIRDEQIAFIEYPAREEKSHGGGEHHSIGSLFHRSNKSTLKSRLTANADILRASSSLTEIIPGEDTLKHIGLGRLTRHVDENTSYYLLSDDVESNAEYLRILEADPFFRDKTIHVTQRQDGLTQQYEMLLCNTGAHFIYPSALAANALARDVSSHPVSVMNIPRDDDFCAMGCASGFNALVLGFGRMGQAVTRFLYEYMAIPGEDGNLAPSRIYVQDEAIDDIKGTFISSSPAAAHNSRIIYEKAGAGSSIFWEKLRERLDSISYIVLSLPDDELNVRLAGEILSFASAKRKGGLTRFKIFLRSGSIKAERNSVVDFFNKRYGCNVLRTFGEMEKIFTTNMIISSYVLGMDNESVFGAKLFIERYFKIAGKTTNTWDEHEEKTRAYKASNDYGSIFKERRKLAQYASRYYFIPTMMALSSGHLEYDAIPAPVLENLARCEHYRYVASMEMAGYIPGPKNNELLLVNDRMVSWDELPDDKKEYYKMIVKASLTE